MFKLANLETENVTFSLEVDEDNDINLVGNGVPLLFLDCEIGKFYKRGITRTQALHLPGLVIKDEQIVIED